MEKNPEEPKKKPKPTLFSLNPLPPPPKKKGKPLQKSQTKKESPEPKKAEDLLKKGKGDQQKIASLKNQVSETKKVIADLRSKADELQGLLKAIRSQSGLTETQWIDYISNPKNFPVEEWKTLYNKMKEFEAPLKEEFLSKPKKSKTTSQKTAEKQSSKRRGRIAPAMRKWIPIP